jgi:hypothetical protein
MTDEVAMASAYDWPPEVVDSLERLGLYGKYSPTSIHSVLRVMSQSQIKGLANSVKGTAFEQLSVADLNSGALGPLPDGGDHVILAEALNQPGWDAEVMKGGVPVDYLQMKATANYHLIARHLARYPEYPDVVTTSEAAQSAQDHGIDLHHLIDANISNLQLSEDVNGALESLDLAHALHDLIPEVSIAVVLTLSGYALARGADRAATYRWAKAQMTKSGISNAAGVAASALTGTTHIRVFAALGARLAVDSSRFATDLAKRFRARRELLSELVWPAD